MFLLETSSDVTQKFTFDFSQDKINKEVGFILANQETIQSQITQLEAAVKQMEVNKLSIMINVIKKVAK